jgi:Cof subfamily protein (haloacid dehalogenase superfamily)
MIKLIAIDLDGTVVNHDLSISETVIQSLQRAQAEFGCKVVIATGRMFPSTIPFSKRVGLSNPVIAYQGAMIRDLSEEKPTVADYPMLYHQGIQKNLAHELLTVIQDRGYHANVYVNDVLYTNELNEKAWYYKSITGVTPVEAPDLRDILSSDPSKIMIIDPQCETVMAELRTQFGEAISVCISRRDFCEIVDPGVSKWVAVEQLMALWNIQASEVMAIGDQENDLTMIQGAGIGVAMGNAPLAIQEVADYVTRDIAADGVAHAIDRFVFQAVS